MRSTTARAYLDGVVSAAMFDRLVAPHLDRRRIGRTLVYTRSSIDNWIESGNRVSGPQTAEGLARLLGNDN